MGKIVRIGGASGFWGDSNEGARQLVASGEVDYIILDYLAELTLSIMAKSRHRDPSLGYATDFVREAMPPIIREVASGKVRVVCNAGGMNPRACADALRDLAARSGVTLKVGIVEGDDVMHLEDRLRADGVTDMFEGFPIPDRVTSLNAYIGAFPIARALDMGAQVVVTGRCVDSALALGPLIHEFGWKEEDFDRLASGSLMGHMIECGTQVTGGLYTDWRAVPGRDNLGYPIAYCHADGSFELGKAEGTGGLITPLVVTEQMLYEVHDPANYLLPDVICDLSDARIDQVGENRVRLSNIRGRPPGPCYKTSATFEDGFRAAATLTIVGSEATEKAEMMGEAILNRTRRLFRERNIGDYRETCVEVLGSEKSAFGDEARSAAREVVLRVSVRHDDERALEIFGREIAPFGTAGVSGTTGFSGRPKAQKVFKLFSVLVPKALVDIWVDMDGTREKMVIPDFGSEVMLIDGPDDAGEPLTTDDETIEVPLRALAVGRSGDKGDMSNIAVICREPDFYRLLLATLSAEDVRDHLAHLVRGEAKRFIIPGVHSLNFLLTGALAGGGSGSLRNDALGKSFAQILLEKRVKVPMSWQSRLAPAG